jgi:hypothetical protein
MPKTGLGNCGRNLDSIPLSVNNKLFQNVLEISFMLGSAPEDILIFALGLRVQ